jgi:tetratricopeptide (TPR) repeat protein
LICKKGNDKVEQKLMNVEEDRPHMEDVSMEMEKFRQAIASIKETLRDKPDLAIARYDLGMLYLKTGDRGSAIHQYRQLMRYDQAIAQRLLEQIFPSRGVSPQGS